MMIAIKMNVICRSVSLLLIFVMLLALTPDLHRVQASTSIAMYSYIFTTMPMLAAGHNHSIALKIDGTVWAWGNNWSGQLGGSDIGERTTPAQVHDINNIIAIAAGGNLHLAHHNNFRLAEGIDMRATRSKRYISKVICFLLVFAMILAFIPNFNIIHAQSSTEQVILPIQQISPFGQQVVEEFLIDFWSLFAPRGWRDLETGIFYVQCPDSWTLKEISQLSDADDLPLVFQGGTRLDFDFGGGGIDFEFDGSSFYDRDGNLITDMPFIRGSSFANQFTLYDLTGDGIPEIVVYFVNMGWSSFGFSGPTILFRFIDGAYTAVGSIDRSSRFFLNPYDEIVVLFDDAYYGVFGYYVLEFVGNSMELTPIVGIDDWRMEWYWHEHHAWPYFDSNLTPTIFGHDTQIARFFPLSDLQDEITFSITQRLKSGDSFPQEGYYIEAFINRPSSIFNVGDNFTISYVLWNHSPDTAETQPWEWTWDSVSIIIGNTSVISAEPVVLEEGVRRMDKRLIVTALSVGTSDITVIDTNSGAEVTIGLEVRPAINVRNSFRMGNIPSLSNDHCCGNIPSFYAFANEWWAREIQTNFHFNGLYINSFTHARTTGGYRVQFNVYNSRYFHGAVDIFDSDGRWINSYRIDKFTSITGLWETGVAAWDLIRNTFTGAALCYTAESYSKRTRIDMFVPEGGHFTVSNNAANSPGTMLYNAFDFIIMGASSIISLVAGNSATDDVAKNFVDNLLSIDKFAEEFVKQLSKMAMEAQVANFWDLPETLSEQVIGIMDLSGIDLSFALSVALGVSESAFIAAAGPAGVGLQFIFGVNRASDLYMQIMQLHRSSNVPFYTVFTPEVRGSFSVTGVTVIPDDGAIDPDAVLQAFRIVTNDHWIFGGMPTYQREVFYISFVVNGSEKVQPSGAVTIMIPVPYGFNRDSINVWHQSDTGVWGMINSQVEGEYIIFQTNRFSLFAIVETEAVASITTNNNYATLEIDDDYLYSGAEAEPTSSIIFVIVVASSVLIFVIIFVIVYSQKKNRR